MKHIKLIMLSSFLWGTINYAQESSSKKYVMTLDQAIDHGLKHSSKAINAQRDLQAARHRKWEATADGLPQIEGSIGYTNNLRIQQSVIPAEAFGGPVGQYRAVGFGIRNAMDARLTLNQLLLNGSFLVVVKLAKTYVEFSEISKLKTESDLKEMIINTYGNVLLVNESLSILEKNKAVLEKNYNDTKEIVKNGLAEEESVEQLAITLASVNNTISYTQKMKESAHKMLKISLGMELEDELELSDNLTSLTQRNISLDILQETFDISKNIDFKVVESNLKNEKLYLSLEKSRRLPSLAATATLGANSFDNREFSFLSPSQKWYDFSSFGVSLRVPIFSSFKSGARIQQYKIKYEQAKTLKEDTDKNLQLAWQNAKSDYQYSIEKYETTKQTLKLAERIESKQQIKFKEGLSTSFEFTEAQRQLYTEQQNYLQAMADVVNKRAALEKILNK